jgi:hypothetical protein
MSSVSGRKYRLHTLVWTLFVQPSDFKPRSSDYSESISNSLVTSSAVLTDTTALDASATAYGRFKVFLMVFSGPSGLYNLDKGAVSLTPWRVVAFN